MPILSPSNCKLRDESTARVLLPTPRDSSRYVMPGQPSVSFVSLVRVCTLVFLFSRKPCQQIKLSKPKTQNYLKLDQRKNAPAPLPPFVTQSTPISHSPLQLPFPSTESAVQAVHGNVRGQDPLVPEGQSLEFSRASRRGRPVGSPGTAVLGRRGIKALRRMYSHQGVPSNAVQLLCQVLAWVVCFLFCFQNRTPRFGHFSLGIPTDPFDSVQISSFQNPTAVRSGPVRDPPKFSRWGSESVRSRGTGPNIIEPNRIVARKCFPSTLMNGTINNRGTRTLQQCCGNHTPSRSRHKNMTKLHPRVSPPSQSIN